MSKIDVFAFLSICLVYLEVIFRIFNKLQLFNISFILYLSFSIIIAWLLSFLFSFLKEKIAKIVIGILLFGLAVYYSTQLCLSNFYGFYLQFSLLGISDQVGDFLADAIKVIVNNGIGIMLLLLPELVFLNVQKKLVFAKEQKRSVLAAIGAAAVYLIALALPVNGVSVYERTYHSRNVALCINDLGVLNTLGIDIANSFSDDQGSLAIEEEEEKEEPEEIVEEPIEYDYNVLDFDWEGAIENSSGKTKEMCEYYASQSGSKQNEYTGYFEGKNLILFMAETFNEIAVNKDLTPTLYKLIHNGFEFSDYYTPTILSTIGGEFMELTGLYVDYGILGTWRKGTNAFPMGLATVFKEAGYDTFAYHDSSYDFQDRHKYLASLGFDNYEGCFNGLEKKMPCDMGWPSKDTDMIEGTFDDYIDSDKFMVFYASVSGHGDYGFSKGNFSNYHISSIYEEEVKAYYGDRYSDHILGYVCGQMEFDRALKLLIDKLEAAGKLDDTVIVFCGDHYPYYLSFEEMSELAGYQRESVIEANSSNLVIYNSTMEKVKVDKPCCTMDVLPTIYNLFRIPYDSRLLSGNDILSNEEGLAVMADRSWVSDHGRYYADSGVFKGDDMLTTYVKKVNDKVRNKALLSYYTIVNDFYAYLFKYRK